MSSPTPAPSPGDDAQPVNSNAPDPRSAPAEQFAAINVQECQETTRHGKPCGKDSVPGHFFCPFHIGNGQLPTCDGCGRRRLRDGLEQTDDGLRCPDCLGGGS